MSKRLQVVMDRGEYDEVQDAADAARLTISAWVRQVLRDARASGAAPQPAEAALDAQPASSAATSATDPQPASSAPGPTPPAATAPPAADPDLVRAVMERHGLGSAAEAIEYALRRAAEPTMGRDEMLRLRGMGWKGDLEALR